MRKTRSDCRVGTFEKKNGLPPGTVKKPKTPSPVFYESMSLEELKANIPEKSRW